MLTLSSLKADDQFPQFDGFFFHCILYVCKQRADLRLMESVGGIYASLVRRQLQPSEKPERTKSQSKDPKNRSKSPNRRHSLSRQSTGAIVDEVSKMECNCHTVSEGCKYASVIADNIQIDAG